MDELYQLFPFAGYKVRHLKAGENDVRVYLDRLDGKPMLCHRCGTSVNPMGDKYLGCFLLSPNRRKMRLVRLFSDGACVNGGHPHAPKHLFFCDYWSMRYCLRD